MKTKKLGRVYFELNYVVDLNDPGMVDHARTCLYEDIMSMLKYDEIYNCIGVREDETAKEEDIPEFLLDTGEFVIEKNSKNSLDEMGTTD